MKIKKYNLSWNKLCPWEKIDNNSNKVIRKPITIMRMHSFNKLFFEASLYIYLIAVVALSLYIIWSFAPSTFCLNFEIK